MCVENLPSGRSTTRGRYRLVILGGGPAATAAAREAAARGVRLALVLPDDDDDQTPRTPLAEQLRRVQIRSGQPHTGSPPDGPNVDVYRGRACFSGRRSVAVDGRELRFRKAVIATGTVPAPAPVKIPGADQGGCLTPERLTELTELPQSLAIIGAGPDACQWAQVLRRLGSQVHLVGRHAGLLPGEDPDAAGVVRARLQDDGIKLHLGCDELRFETTGNLRGVVIGREGQREKLLVDEILLCGPRLPGTAGLGLETASVAFTDRGIIVGDRLQTTNRHVFGAGAVCGTNFGHPEAVEVTARLAVYNALHLTGRRLSRLVIPRCVHTDPQLVQVGLTLDEAAERQIEIDTYRAELSQAAESLPPDHHQGFIAVHVRRRSGRLVGATVVAEGADELAAPLLLLMTRKWPLTALADVIPCRSGRFELLTRLAQRCPRPRLSSRLRLSRQK